MTNINIYRYNSKQDLTFYHDYKGFQEHEAHKHNTKYVNGSP